MLKHITKIKHGDLLLCSTLTKFYAIERVWCKYIEPYEGIHDFLGGNIWIDTILTVKKIDIKTKKYHQHAIIDISSIEYVINRPKHLETEVWEII